MAPNLDQAQTGVHTVEEMVEVRSNQGFFTVQQTCPQCSGSGEEITNPCTDCNGQGNKQVSKKYQSLFQKV